MTEALQQLDPIEEFVRLGATGYFCFVASALGAIGGVTLLHRRRKALVPPLAVAFVLMGIGRWLSGIGARGVDFASQGLRVGFFRTHSGAPPGALRAVCRVLPDYALAIGRAHVRRAGAAAVVLGGRIAWAAPDSAAVWFSFDSCGPLPSAARGAR